MNIYFYTPDYFSGGVKVIYRHAAILQENKIPAYVLLTQRSTKQKYFEHKATVKYWSDVSFKEDDIVVMPEYISSWINESKNPQGLKRKIKQKFSKNRYQYLAIDIFNSRAKKVVYNQNPYYTFLDYPVVPNTWDHVYLRNDCLATICVSSHIEQYLKICFEQTPVFRTYCGINNNLFTASKQKKKQISYLTFKNSRDVAQVISILTLRNKLKGFTLLPVKGDEKEVAEKFNESLVMLNFGNVEGFGLPAAEAMLSGCVVIGYDGGAGKEFMKPEHCITISNGDIMSFVMKVEEVVDQLSRNESHYLEMTSKARDFIVSNYSPEREKESVLNAWRNVLNLTKIT